MAESAGDLASPAPAPEPGSFFGALPEDVLSDVYAVLPAYSLRAAAATNRAWCNALKAAPDAVRRRARWLHRWTAAGAGASIHSDPSVCSGGGTWHPGGVALASTLRLSTEADAGFRLVLEDPAPGDLLMGITLHPPDPEPAQLAAEADGSDPLDMGYHFLLGRNSHSAGLEGGATTAPRSIFYGGRSRRCCFAVSMHGCRRSFSLGCALTPCAAEPHGGPRQRPADRPRARRPLTGQARQAAAPWRLDRIHSAGWCAGRDRPHGQSVYLGRWCCCRRVMGADDGLDREPRRRAACAAPAGSGQHSSLALQ